MRKMQLVDLGAHGSSMSILTIPAKFMKAVGAILFCCILGGCGVVSDTPLSPKRALPGESLLIGAWLMEERKEKIYLHIGNENEFTRIVSISIRADGKIKVENYEAAPIRINDTDYLSVEVRSKGNGNPVYYIFQYSVSNDSALSFWPIDSGFMENAIKKGLIAGRIDTGLFTSVVIQADQRALQDFVKEYGSQMFTGKSVVFQRVK